ncbi:MAG: hypothetical protein WA133_07570 [Syntrophales bacterium]
MTECPIVKKSYALQSLAGQYDDYAFLPDYSEAMGYLAIDRFFDHVDRLSKIISFTSRRNDEYIFSPIEVVGWC